MELCEDELRALLQKLVDHQYNTTAEYIFDYMFNSGVEVKIDPSIVNSMTLEEFLSSK